jgi:hypothetical protein
MTDQIEIYHPKTKATVTVPASSLPHHERAGWQLAKKNKAAAGDRDNTEEN